jgi:phospholipid transport system substrate-binding protein
MKVDIRSFLVVLFAILLSGRLCALESSGPLNLVEFTVSDVVADMNSNQLIYEQHPDQLKAMVLERVAPHFNFNRMIQLAMANHWAQATEQQRRLLVDEFRQLMVRTYANAMFTFRNEPVNLIGEKKLGSRSAVVRLSVTNTSTGNPVAVMLRMENRNDRWQVIDVVVDGVSMIITYRGTFAEEISRSGVDGLIASIKEDNLKKVAQ